MSATKSSLPSDVADGTKTHSKVAMSSNEALSLAPLLSVRRGKEAIEFYKRAFSAQESFRTEDEQGEVVAHLTIAGASFWLADESPSHGNFSPETLGGGTIRIVLTTPDPDALFEQAVSAGAKVVWPVADQRYGWRVGRLVDPFGHHWEIGRPLH